MRTCTQEGSLADSQSGAGSTYERESGTDVYERTCFEGLLFFRLRCVVAIPLVVT